MTLTLPSSSRNSLVSQGAVTMATVVTTTIRVSVSVNSWRTKRSPRSGSSFSARTSTGTTSAVSTEPSTISVMMFGSVLAVLNADATAGPSAAPIITVRMNPVMREISVATAMEPVARTTDWLEFSSVASASCAAGASRVATAPPLAPARVSPLGLVVRSERSGSPVSATGSGLGSRGAGTGAGGAGATMRLRRFSVTSLLHSG